MQLHEKIPNNVNLSQDRRLLRALEKWQPNYLKWWQEAGPADFQADDIYLRTAIDVGSDGWAHFDYVKMPDYRWGILRSGICTASRSGRKFPASSATSSAGSS